MQNEQQNLAIKTIRKIFMNSDNDSQSLARLCFRNAEVCRIDWLYISGLLMGVQLSGIYANKWDLQYLFIYLFEKFCQTRAHICVSIRRNFSQVFAGEYICIYGMYICGGKFRSVRSRETTSFTYMRYDSATGATCERRDRGRGDSNKRCRTSE